MSGVYSENKVARPVLVYVCVISFVEPENYLSDLMNVKPS